MDLRIEDQVTVYFPDPLGYLPLIFCGSPVPHGQEDASDLRLGESLLPGIIHELNEPHHGIHCKVASVQRDVDVIRIHDGVYHIIAERRPHVHENEVIPALDGCQDPLQHGIRRLDIIRVDMLREQRQLILRRNQIQAFLDVQDVRSCVSFPDGLHDGTAGVLVDAVLCQHLRRISLRVKVHDQHIVSGSSHDLRYRHGTGCLTNSALLEGKDNSNWAYASLIPWLFCFHAVILL